LGGLQEGRGGKGADLYIESPEWVGLRATAAMLEKKKIL